jgi:YVTN family beta-propeller protein
METNMRVAVLAVGALLAVCASSSAFAAGSAPVYRVTKTVSLGAGERWDYVSFDPSSSRVYASHGDHVTVVDGKTGAVIGQIGTFPGGTHGIAISTPTGHGYTDDGKAGVAVAFDTASLKPLKQIATAPDADGILLEPATGHVLVVNGDSGSLSVIDPAADAVVATVSVGAGLEAAVADGKGIVFVDGVDRNDIVKIDALRNTVVAHWPMPACVRPHGLAIDIVAHRLFATCSNNLLVVVDADSGANIATFPIGSYSDGAAFDPIRKLAFSSNGDGTLSVIREMGPNSFALAGTVPTMPSARTLAIDPQSGRIFLVAAYIAKIDPPAAPGGRPHVTYVPGSLKLIFLDPQD